MILGKKCKLLFGYMKDALLFLFYTLILLGFGASRFLNFRHSAYKYPLDFGNCFSPIMNPKTGKICYWKNSSVRQPSTCGEV
jgi:hypothetical protein